jgi:NAD(P)-dependent dehydrogenase (short-subunit alcohol dehydrogenase family)
MITDEYRVDGKVAIVTGAGRGIGKAIALVMAEAGANVSVVARTREQVEQTAEDIRKLGRKALAIPADVSREEQVKKVVEQTISQFGKIDILVNNAGIAVRKPIALLPGEKMSVWGGTKDEAQTVEEWQRVMDVNLTSAFLFAQAVGPHMMKQRRGKIINTSSTCADEGLPGISAYSASKAGLSTFTRCLASEWGPFNINVNAIAPGMIVTEMTEHHFKDPKNTAAFLERIPLGRLGQPRDVALLVLFLAAEASDYLTGQTFTVDGGAMGRGIGI